jgi:hypothetical protein
MLSSRSFLLTSLIGSGTLHIYTFDPSPPHCVATLLLPATKCRSGLSPLESMSVSFHCGPLSRPQPRQPFQPHACLEDAIHVISLLYVVTQPMLFRLFVRNSTFLEYVSRSDLTATPIIPWNMWGPHRTRMLHATYGYGYHWMRRAHGQRVVFPAGDRSLEVLDFSPGILRQTEGLLRCNRSTTYS